MPEGRGGVAGPAAAAAGEPGSARPRRRARRPRRRARAPARATRARGRRRRAGITSCSPAARHREDDARPPAADDPAAPRGRRGARGHAHPLRRRSRAVGRVWRAGARSARRTTPRRPPPSSAAAEPAPPRRGDARASRRVVPRRAGRVPTARARRAAPAARGARRADLTSGDGGRVPCRLPPRRVLEPVPVRAGRAELRMHGDATRPLPPPPLGAAPRPFRPAPRGPPTRAGRRAR